MSSSSSAPRICYFDIETAPSLGYYFDLWKEGNIVSTKCPWYLLSFAHQWEGDDRVHCRALPDYPGYKNNKTDDTKLATDLWRVFNEADVLIGHNSIRFDEPKSAVRFIVAGLPPPKPHKSIDTLRIAKRHFKFDSNRLDALGQVLDVGRKLKHTGFSLWQGCMDGDPKSWAALKKYNRQDVRLLVAVYKKLRAYSTAHPNLAAYGDGTGCEVCRSQHVTRQGFKVNRTRKVQQFKCQDCGHWFSSTKVAA